MRVFFWAALFAAGLVATAAASAEQPQHSEAVDPVDIPDASEVQETFQFQAEVNRMMKLIVHSLYKSKEIFLRELISNASDALDKLRIYALTHSDALATVPDLNITVRADKEKKRIIITDTGIGMTKKDLVNNLGTLAKSGTAEFMAALEKSDTNLIGQFGVGFYSAFLVADTVTVISKNNDDKQYIWESHSEQDFSIREDPRGNTLGRGTQIILHLKDDAVKEFTDDKALEKLIRKYSEFINFPIFLYTTKTEEIEVPIEEDDEMKKAVDDEENKNEEKEETTEDGEKKEDDEATVEDVKEEEKPKTKKVERTVNEWERMNPLKPLWRRDPSNVTEEEYEEFYKAFTKETSKQLAYTHFKGEGDAEFRSLLFIPSKAPPNLLQQTDTHIKCIKLFVKRVFITDELLDFIPKYLGFLKGLVDADDFPLNVSRETLQQHRLLKIIKKKVIGKALALIKTLSEDPEKYEEFMKEFGTNLKLGSIEDARNKKKILKLLRFHSSYENRTSLDAYIKRMKKNQPQIYFLTGSSLEEIKKSPFVERIIARGYEVLYMDEPIDEYVVQSNPEYESKPFQNVAKDGLKFGDETEDTKKKDEELTKQFQPLATWLQVVLAQHVDKVVVSSRLTTSPAAIVAPQYGWAGYQERLMSSQALKSGEDYLMQFYANQKKIFEINPNHPVIAALLEKVSNNENDENTGLVARVLYESTAIRSGYALKDSADYFSKVERLLRLNLGVDPDAKVVIEDIEKAPEAEPSAESDDSKNEVTEEAEADIEDDEDRIMHDEL